MEDGQRDLELILEEEEPLKYRIGSTFIETPLETIQGNIEQDLAQLKEDLESLHQKKKELEATSLRLKAVLNGKFGDSIKLDAS